MHEFENGFDLSQIWECAVRAAWQISALCDQILQTRALVECSIAMVLVRNSGEIHHALLGAAPYLN